MASAGSLAEHSDPYGIDEAFSKVHTGVFWRRWNTQRRDGPVSVRKWSSGGMLAMNGMFFIVAILSQSVSTRASWYSLFGKDSSCMMGARLQR